MIKLSLKFVFKQSNFIKVGVVGC